jgi:hypothetical protein
VHFVNAGSVGRRTDGDPRAGCVIVDSSHVDSLIEIRRVDDVAAAAGGIEESELPSEFAGSSLWRCGYLIWRVARSPL